MRSDAENTLTHTAAGLPDENAPTFLIPLLQWNVLEDRDTLERASVEKAKRVFNEWRAGTSVERDGEGADNILVRAGRVARFRYFVMVDDESLASMQDVEGDAARTRRAILRRMPPIKVRVVDGERPDCADDLSGFGPRVAGAGVASAQVGGDGNSEEEDEESEEEDYGDMEDAHEPVEGCTDWEVGWMWVETWILLDFYDTVQADQGFNLFYERPPKVYPRYYPHKHRHTSPAA
ncbi:hypothetical protein IMZ48_46065 [Candidatus Bathyarchaeota archaeon]|nr:hypothetical protein [Candidatus Bathyarchaeota archaeon]